MKITVKYNNSWRGKFLKGDDDQSNFLKNRGLMRKGSRDFYVPEPTPITKNTVSGILYRLMGERRKLWRVPSSDYPGIHDNLSFMDRSDFISHEAIALRDITNASNPAGWVGVANNEDNVFLTNPNIYQVLFSPLVCTPQEMYDIIVNNNIVRYNNINITSRLDVLDLVNRIDKSDIDKLSVQQRVDMINALKNHFVSVNYKQTDVDKYEVFCFSAMYLCSEYIERQGYSETGKSWRKGFSKRGCTPREIYGAMSSGINSVINFPMDDNFRRKTKKVEKHTGKLDIFIDVSIDRAEEIKKAIEDANVGCITVGKKGLAYLSDIDVYGGT